MLQPPKRTTAGYLLSMNPHLTSPPVPVDSGIWTPSDEWCAWADELRKKILGELLSHGSWFSKPPRREILDPLFSPWYGTLQGKRQFFFKPEKDSSGIGTWVLEGLIMTSTSISPVFTVGEFTETREEGDAITLFDTEALEEREVTLDEIESEGVAPTPIRNREWETKKFLSKERVREARLKAQIAARMAQEEEARYIRHFGEIDDNESHFSDYDLTDSDNSSDEELLT
jgi:hypothetical protein